MASIHKHGAGYRAMYTDHTGKSKAGPTLPTVPEVEKWVRLSLILILPLLR